jgi:inosose dehydratase
MFEVRCYTNCYGPWGVWVAAEQLRRTGIDALELALRPHNQGGLVVPEEVVITQQTSEARVASFKDHVRTHGVKITSCNIGGADPCTTEGIALLLARLECARRWFGVEIVVSGAGQPANSAERDAAIANLSRLGDAARALGMVVALETHKGPTQNADTMLELMNELKHESIGINFDTGNIAYYNRQGNPVHELERVMPWVRNVHLKDNRGGFEDWYFPALGVGGAVNFEKVRRVLEESSYRGACTIEIEGIAGEAEPGLEARHQRVNESVRHLRACGFLS